MSQPLTRQPAIPMPSFAALRANAEQVAGLLARAAGAWACYLALSGNAGQRPLLLVAGGGADSSPRSLAEAAPLLRRMRDRRLPVRVVLNDQPALALSLVYEGRRAGAALLVYHDEAAVDIERAQAASEAACYALDAARQIAALHIQAEEIAERARVREIQVSRNLIRSVIDGIPLGLVLLDSDGTVLAVNRALSERFDLDPIALVGMGYSSAIGPWEDSPAAHTFTTGMAGRVRRTITRPDRSQVFLEVASFPLLDADDRPQQVIEVWEDITERVVLQTQLVRVEKLAAIGQLAASIAHEVGNPLQAIQGFLSLFLEQSPQAMPNRQFLELAEEEIERIVQVVSRLRDLYRSRADVVEPVDLNGVIEHVLLLTSKQLERVRITATSELDPLLPRVQGMTDQIKQVLLNLVLNAAEAMPNGGMLRVQTSISDAAGVGSAAVITVADTGVGIAPEQIPYIFDGLHTTKERGMGLGLYTSKAIIERHMGRLAVRSTVGKGTVFTITLPAVSEETR